MISSLNLAYHVKESRSWFRVRTIALGLSVLILLLLLLSMLLALVGGHFIQQLGSGLRLQPVVVPAWRALRWPAVILFLTASCSLIYAWGPDLKESRRGIWYSPGSAFGVFVLLAGSFMFRIYLNFSNNYSAAFGSLGAVMILLVWLYVAGLAYIIGGEINAEIERAEEDNEFGIDAPRIES